MKLSLTESFSVFAFFCPFRESLCPRILSKYADREGLCLYIVSELVICKSLYLWNAKMSRFDQTAKLFCSSKYFILYNNFLWSIYFAYWFREPDNKSWNTEKKHLSPIFNLGLQWTWWYSWDLHCCCKCARDYVAVKKRAL